MSSFACSTVRVIGSGRPLSINVFSVAAASVDVVAVGVSPVASATTIISYG
jgi:hypothetical protein